MRNPRVRTNQNARRNKIIHNNAKGSFITAAAGVGLHQPHFIGNYTAANKQQAWSGQEARRVANFIADRKRPVYTSVAPAFKPLLASDRLQGVSKGKRRFY